MCMADPGVIRIRGIRQATVRRIALDEGAISHPRVIQHKAPLRAEQLVCRSGIVGDVMCSGLEVADEWRDRGWDAANLRSRRAVRTPASAEGGGDGGILLSRGREVGEHGPRVSVLGVQGSGFVVEVER